VILVSNGSCNKDCNDISSYIFELPVTLSPAKDTFNIGDTITITSTFSDVVFDRSTLKYFKLVDFKFYPEMRMREISDTATNEAALLNFEVLIDGSYNFVPFQYSDGVSLVGQYNYSNNKYQLEYKIIPTKAGLFYHSIFTLLFEFGKNQDFDGRCPHSKAGLDTYQKLNDGADNNVGFLLDSPEESWHFYYETKRESQFNRFGGYCFYVKE